MHEAGFCQFSSTYFLRFSKSHQGNPRNFPGSHPLPPDMLLDLETRKTSGKYEGNMQENEGIKEYMLPYTWTMGLGKIPGLPARKGVGFAISGFMGYPRDKT